MDNNVPYIPNDGDGANEIQLNEIHHNNNASTSNNNNNNNMTIQQETTIGIDINYDLTTHIKENMKSNKTGMFVQANDLSYYIPSKSHENKKLSLLNNISFTMQPGRMVLLMGIPGSGKSLLLKVLGNRLGKGKVEGELRFNNHSVDRSTHQRDTIFVSQDDRHIALLTVKETLEFSAKCNMGEKVSEEQQKERVNLVLEQLGLTHTSNTIIGNQFFRGISGGQKRRVTIANEFTKQCPNLILMDEPSTGLDSATSYNVISKVKTIATEARASVMVSLLQPSVELTNLFDDVLILGEGGNLVYFGPLNSLLPYFESIGLAPLPDQPIAEFMQEVSVDPSKYSITNKISIGADIKNNNSIDLIKLFKESEMHQSNMVNLNQLIPNDIKLFDHSIEKIDTGDDGKSSIRYELKHLLIRHIKVMKIMKMQYFVRFFQAIFMGCVIGSLFVQMGDTQADARNRFGLMYFSMVLNIWTTIGSVEEFYTLRGIFDDQKDGKYYRTFPYFMSLVITKIPITLIEALLFSSCCYWIAGFRGRADSFIVFVLGIALTNLIAQGIFQVTSAFSSTQLLASLICPAVVVLFMIMCGYMIPKPQIPGWWIWLNALSPLKYIIDMLASNELYGLTFRCAENEFIPPSSLPNFNLPYPQGYNGSRVCQYSTGQDFLHLFGFSENYYMRWVDIVIILGFVVAFFTVFYLGLKYVKFENKKPPKQIKLKKKKEKKEKKQIDVKHKWNGCYMTFQNLNYSVTAIKKNVETGKDEKLVLELLKDVNGFIVPGMCALMGPSGAGKSTLMDVLAKRKNQGTITGDIMINGELVKDMNITRFTGYVEQQDILSANLTIREAIEFSANCRLPSSYPEKDRIKLIDEILVVLSLTKLQNTTIGPNPTLGISLANRKKVSIGIELASDPHLIFLDEPTSGLDSAAALKVMNCVKKIAESGRTVVCTIHQPSQEIFEKFDQLLLLDKGKVIYFGETGENSSTVINHFTSAGYEYQNDRNPADFILEIAEQPPANVAQSASEYFKSSSHYSNSIERLTLKNIVPAGAEVPKYKGKYSAPATAQLYSLIKRGWLNHIRRPQTIILRFLRSFIPAIIIGTLFLRLDNDQTGARNRVALLFLGFLFGGMASIGKVPTVVEDRSVYYRESSAGTYPAHLYIVASVITDLPMMVLTAFSYWIPMFFLSGLSLGDNGWKFFFSLGVYLLAIMCYDSLATLFALLLPTIPVAILVSGVGLNFLGLFSGFFIPRNNIPRGWIWMHYLVFSKYGLESLVISELKGEEFYCTSDQETLIPVNSNGTIIDKSYCAISKGDTMLLQYGMETAISRQFYNCLILGAYFIGYTFIGWLALKYINHMKR